MLRILIILWIAIIAKSVFVRLIMVLLQSQFSSVEKSILLHLKMPAPRAVFVMSKHQQMFVELID